MPAVGASPMLTYMLVSGITPGPNNLTMLYLGAEYGLRGTRRFLTASVGCFLLKSLLCGLFNLLLAELLPTAVVYLKWLGAAYMLYLAVKMALSGWKAAEGADGKKRESTYRSGVILQLLNMKSWISCLSLYVVYAAPEAGSAWTVVWMALAYSCIILLCSVCWGLFGTAMQKLLKQYRKPFGIVMGAALAYCAITAVL